MFGGGGGGCTGTRNYSSDCRLQLQRNCVHAMTTACGSESAKQQGRPFVFLLGEGGGESLIFMICMFLSHLVQAQHEHVVAALSSHATLFGPKQQSSPTNLPAWHTDKDPAPSPSQTKRNSAV